MKKFDKARMTDQELDTIAGGKGYVYFLKENGKFHYVACDHMLTNDEIVHTWQNNGILPLKTDEKGNVISQSYQIELGRGLRPEDVPATMSRLEKTYGGCEYIEFR